jgi:hypothetical protein
MIKKKHFATIIATLGVFILVGCISPTAKPSEIPSEISTGQDMGDTKTEDVTTGSVSESGFSYPTNNNGQTYGTYGNIDAEKALAGEFPDLIAVIADNGEHGYVYRADYEMAWRTNVQYRTEAAAAEYEADYTAELNAFCDYYFRKTGTAADLDMCDSVLRDIDTKPGRSAPWKMLSDQQKAAIRDLFPDGYRSLDVAQEAYEEALRSNDYVVPVFMLDGKTKIGDMTVVW